jgi:hypothetical protein
MQDPNAMLGIFLGLKIIYLPFVDSILVWLEENNCTIFTEFHENFIPDVKFTRTCSDIRFG